MKGQSKELEIRPTPDGLYIAAFRRGGEVPDILKGSWTNTRDLQQMIDYYVSSSNK